MKIPDHVAIIMDGNGRWAQKKGRPRIFGHIRGSSQVRPIVTECGHLGIKFLTLYCFSAENWGRPQDEVSVLMRILQKYLVRELKTLMKNNIRLRAIGELETLPENVKDVLYQAIASTSHNTGLTLTFALSYGSRQEMVAAVKKIAGEVSRGELSVDQVNEQLFSQNLGGGDGSSGAGTASACGLPDPDLVIRTSGEYRISNFLLWQSAYSEFYFTEKFWPEFTVLELHKALENYSKRARRFGLTDQQLKNPLKIAEGAAL